MIYTLTAAALGVFRRWFRWKDHRLDLHSADEMRRILERERARADRTGARLSVVTFAAPSSADEDVTMAWLAKILKGRLRSIDEAGWLDERRICAVLPGTPPPGAWKVVDDICRDFPANAPPPLCGVYSYPDTPSAGQDTAPATRDRDVVPLHQLLTWPLPVWKRLLDLLGAAAGLVVLAPLLAGIAFAVKVSSSGPVFFRQRRSGRGGRPFVIYKFRTMVVDAEARQAELLARNERDGPAFKLKRDPRITRLGRVLRGTSLDELPQLWNVFKGDMSLVGPRPLPCAESDGCTGWQRQRLDVTPGLTCIWQVRGRGGVPFDDWMRMDVRYIRSRSPWNDLKLLLLTVPAVLLRRGAH